MSMSNSLPPAGWYPDPEGSFRQRWWSGNNWTNDFAQYRPTQIHVSPPDILAHLREQPAQVQAPAVAAVPEHVTPAASQYVQQSAQADAYRATPQAPPQLPSALRGHGAVGTLLREPQTSVLVEPETVATPPQVAPSVVPPIAPAIAIVPLSPSPSSASVSVNPNMMSSYEPFGRQSWVRHGHRAKADRKYTTASWFLALVPALAVATISVIALLVPVMATWFVYAAVTFVCLLAGIALAVADRRTLRIEDHIHTASPIWAALSPAPYLIARSVRVSRETGSQAHWPLVIFLVATATAAAVLAFMPGLLDTILSSPVS